MDHLDPGALYIKKRYDVTGSYQNIPNSGKKHSNFDGLQKVSKNCKDDLTYSKVNRLEDVQDRSSLYTQILEEFENSFQSKNMCY
jgi:hypothetical protein